MARGDAGYKKVKERTQQAETKRRGQIADLQTRASTPHLPFLLSRKERRQAKRWGK